MANARAKRVRPPQPPGNRYPHRTKVQAGCKCAGCENVRAQNRASYHRNKVSTVDPRIQRVLDALPKAKEFLDDGCTYAETARTLGIDREALRRRMPGYERNHEEFRKVRAWISHSDSRLAIYREIWRPNAS